MKEFKPLKELVKALTYIGDAIAGKVTSNTQNTSNEYDGIIYYYDGDGADFYTSSGIKNVEFSDIVKLGDIASKNLIDDINIFYDADWLVQKIYSKSNDNKVIIGSDEDLEGFITSCAISIRNNILIYSKYNYEEGYRDDRTYELSDSLGHLTENTILSIYNA